ncbi:peroxidase-related enzyme [Paracoccaceae bacterium]|jgi:uncharacterized peroxidase-related enzyme|nr:peroxidase-related enzyme [Paracoccaceae bacterium]MDB4229825.1 peroxidase-related enzyme [Paracoccaceae bacterium]|tara:strand:+ start:6388 stop:6963 length:576 start_codon:yes stop_codon:yes gene_type:complete
MSAWIKMISDKDADEELSEVLNLARTPHGTVDNVMRVHSLRPSTMKGHVTLYRAALHDESNTIPMWFQETISSYVSILNDCPYSYANHWKNAAHLMQDPTKAKQVEIALNAKKPKSHFIGAELVMLEYTEKLTLKPGEMVETDVIKLRENGVDDGQILELNQIIGYFNYVNRLLNGLGVTTSGDTVGFYKD